MELDFVACTKLHLFLQWVVDNKPDTNSFYSNTRNAFKPYHQLILNLYNIREGKIKVIIPFNVMMDVSSVKLKYWDEYQKHQKHLNDDL